MLESTIQTPLLELSLFVTRMEAICMEMGVVLKRSAFSPNIKDRLDFSCALFDAQGGLCAQAAHIPVHLGSMAYAMKDIVDRFEWQPGDVLIVNDPYMGGTHLPDVTLIAPVFVGEQLVAFVVNRAHHANIGSDTPGSMPLASSLEEEGVLISPQKLVVAGVLDLEFSKNLFIALNPTALPQANLSGDLAAQNSALSVGLERVGALIGRMGVGAFIRSMIDLNNYGEAMARSTLAQLPTGSWSFEDVMDDDGLGAKNIKIKVLLSAKEGALHADFTGTHGQVKGNINCPLAVTAAAVYYVLRCLLPEKTPTCAGIFRSVSFTAPQACLLNAQAPAAVAAGNVETSTRIVDVMLGALQQALPGKIPAASQGTMNNLAMGMHSETEHWDYYETLAGGMGAGPAYPGCHATHSHMTNTLNTPIESLELHYPLRVKRYEIRRGSGGMGRHAGGDGLIREYEFLAPAQLSLLTERRQIQPWGLLGGEAGKLGSNTLNGVVLPGKTSISALTGDCLCIQTPGGGGWGKVE